MVKRVRIHPGLVLLAATIPLAALALPHLLVPPERVLNLRTPEEAALRLASMRIGSARTRRETIPDADARFLLTEAERGVPEAFARLVILRGTPYEREARGLAARGARSGDEATVCASLVLLHDWKDPRYPARAALHAGDPRPLVRWALSLEG